MSIEPNLTGFADAQERLRDKLGLDITFYWPLAMTWPAGTQLNPETGRPFNPTVVPTASGEASASVRCSVIHRPFGLSRTGIEDQQTTTAVGMLSDENVGLIVKNEALWVSASAATEFEYLGERFEIRDTPRDTLGSVTRQLVVGEKK